MEQYKGIIERYRKFMPVTSKTPVITLHEGNTPLIRLKRLEALVSDRVELYVKYEGLNPTGSFKDRGMTMAISKAVEKGMKADNLRLHGQYFRLGRGLFGARGH